MNPVKITETFKSLSYMKKKRTSQKSDYYWNGTNAKLVTENDQLNNFYDLTGAKALPIFLNVFLNHFPSKIKMLIIKKNDNNNNKWTLS